LAEKHRIYRTGLTISSVAGCQAIAQGETP
jgi:hypothetical protein